MSSANVQDADQEGSDRDRSEEETATTGQQGCWGSCLCNPKSYCHQGIALFLMCMLSFGSYFCFDNPGALQKVIMDVMKVDNLHYENLYSLYSWPNVVLPVVGGFLIDRFLGIRLGAVLFSLFLVLGQGVTSLGAYLDSFVAMECGRFVFGLGGESLAVAQSTYASSWFKGAALNMVFGLQLSVSRVGSTFNFLAMAPLYDAFKDANLDGNSALAAALAVAMTSLVLSLVGAVVLAALDKRRARLLRDDSVVELPKVQLKDIFKFRLNFWLITASIVSYYVAIFPFISIGQDFFKTRFHMDQKDANFINGLVYLISAFTSPVFGFLIDRVGRNIYFVISACIMTVLSHCLLGFTDLTPYVGVVLMAVSYSVLAASLWPIIAMIISENLLGTAYGIAQAIQNLGLATVSLLVGLIVDKAGYVYLEGFFVGILGIATLCSLALFIIDRKNFGYLNMNLAQRKVFESSLEYRRLLGIDPNDEDQDREALVGGDDAEDVHQPR